MKAAAIKPDIFRSLIVHEPPLYGLFRGDPSVPQVMIESRKHAQEAIRLIEKGDKINAARLFTETLTLGPGSWDRLPAQTRETMIANADTWLDETKDPNGLLIDPEALGKFQRPTLLMYGGRGLPGSNLIIEKLARTIPNSKVRFFPNEGHIFHISNPREFVTTVTGFANSSESAS